MKRRSLGAAVDDVELNRLIERRLNAMSRHVEHAEADLGKGDCYTVSDSIESASWEGGRAESYILVQGHAATGAARRYAQENQTDLSKAKARLESAARKFHLRCLKPR